MFQFQVNDSLLHWLTNIHFEEYFKLFVNAGYDLPTVSKMTPEDLTAVGIKNPSHRRRLMDEISKLNVPDGLPDYIPVKIQTLSSMFKRNKF